MPPICMIANLKAVRHHLGPCSQPMRKKQKTMGHSKDYSGSGTSSCQPQLPLLDDTHRNGFHPQHNMYMAAMHPALSVGQGSDMPSSPSMVSITSAETVYDHETLDQADDACDEEPEGRVLSWMSNCGNDDHNDVE